MQVFLENQLHACKLHWKTNCMHVDQIEIQPLDPNRRMMKESESSNFILCHCSINYKLHNLNKLIIKDALIWQ